MSAVKDEAKEADLDVPESHRVSDMVDLQQVVLQVSEPREYSGKEAHFKLNKIAEALHESILNVCASHVKTDLLVKFYDLYDEACYHVIMGNYWLNKNPEVNMAMEKASSILRYLLEAAIYAGSNSESRVVNDYLISALMEIADLYLEVCKFSDYLYHGNFLGGFSVSSQGDIDFSVDERMKAISKIYFEQIRIRRIAIKLEKLQKEPIKDFDRLFQDLTEPYDKAFEKTYGVKFSTLAKIMLFTIKKIAKNRFGTIKIPHTILIKRLTKGLEYDKKTLRKALKFFEIDGEFLSKGWRHYKFLDVPISVSRRPIIRLSGKIGGKGALLLGPNALMKAFVHQLNDVMRGIVALEIPPELSSEERGRKFEKKIHAELVQYGFKALRFKEPPSNVGDIDAVAVREDKGILLVIEAKSRKMDFSPKKIKWQLEKAREWCSQLDEKVEWVKGNLDLIAKRLQFDKNKIHDLIGMIVSEVPWYYETDLPFRMATLEELKLWLMSLP